MDVEKASTLMNIIDKIDNYLDEGISFKDRTDKAKNIVKQLINKKDSEKQAIKKLTKVVNQPSVKVDNRTYKMSQSLIDAIWDEWESYQFGTKRK